MAYFGSKIGILQMYETHISFSQNQSFPFLLLFLFQGTLCGQYGVECSNDGFVTHLKLPGNNLTGTIPSAEIFANLQNVKFIHSQQTKNRIKLWFI